jgi:hypothetical protein
VTDARALLSELAVPRLSGSPGNLRVRAVLQRELAARGFVVMEQRFVARPRRPLWGPSPAEAVNLIAVRPRARVTTWLVAHYDSKGQPISMAARVVGAVAVATAVVAAIAAFAAGARGSPIALGLAAAVAALFVALNRVTNRSPGAVDNATALITILATVDALPAGASVGVIFPDAEEFGLEGARALVRERAHLLAGTGVINLDGIDDGGSTRLVRHGPAGPLTRSLASHLGVPAVRRLPVLEDGFVLARAAAECLTVLRGSWSTARVVHTPRDLPERLTLEGSRAVALALAAALSQA